MKNLFYLLTFLLLLSLGSSILLFGGSSVSVSADFSADKTTVVVGETVTFTDASNATACGGTINSWSWDFGADASPPDASDVGPHAVTYSSVGMKEIQLIANSTATGFCSPDTETKTNYITVIAAEIPTLSEWALILLALLFMNLGTVAIAQEQLSLVSNRNYSLPFTRLQLPFSSAHFNKGIVLTAIFALVGFAASIFLTGTIAASDLIGVFVTAPVFAYLVHLLWMVKEK